MYRRLVAHTYFKNGSFLKILVIKVAIKMKILVSVNDIQLQCIETIRICGQQGLLNVFFNTKDDKITEFHFRSTVYRLMV